MPPKKQTKKDNFPETNEDEEPTDLQNMPGTSSASSSIDTIDILRAILEQNKKDRQDDLKQQALDRKDQCDRDKQAKQEQWQREERARKEQWDREDEQRQEARSHEENMWQRAQKAKKELLEKEAQEKKDQREREKQDKKDLLEQEAKEKKDQRETERQERQDLLEKEDKTRQDQLEREEATRKTFREKEEQQYHDRLRDQKLERDLMEEKKRKAEKKATTLGKMGKFNDDNNLDKYLQSLEKVLIACDVAVEEWPIYLQSHLTGRPLYHLNNSLTEEQRDNYRQAKDALLMLAGCSLDACADKVFHHTATSSTSNDRILEDCQYLMNKFRDAAKNKFEMAEMMAQRMCLSAFSKECAAFVTNRKPADTVAFLTELQLFQDQHGRSLKPHSQPTQGKKEFFNQTKREYGGSFKPRTHQDKRYQHTDGPNRSHPESTQRFPPAPAYTYSRPEETRFDYSNAHCYSCGEKGHRKFECPNRKPWQEQERPGKQIKKVTTNLPSIPITIQAIINGTETDCQLDSAAEISITKQDLVPEVKMLGESIYLTGIMGAGGHFPLAEVRVQAADVCFSMVTAVVPDEFMPNSVLLGHSLGMNLFHYLFSTLRPAPQVLITRAQKVALETEQEESRQEMEKQRPNVKDPVEIDDRRKEETPPEGKKSTEAEGKVEDAGEVDPADLDRTITGTPPPTEKSKEDETLELPELKKGEEKSLEDFESETETDISLKRQREEATQGKNGYGWKGKLITRNVTDEFGREREILLVPTSQRTKLVQMSHDLAKHQGSKKMMALLSRSYLWPGMRTDVNQHCTTCTVCQRHRKQGDGKAPLEPVPVFTSPFQHLALDIVGPFKPSKKGYMYMLTCICLATRYPEAIPLRRATAKDVAEKLLDIISRTGIPETILTDQGSIFIGEMMTMVCKTLNINQIKTTPYHPESNGIVERFHGTIVPMIKKSIDRDIDWPDHVPLSLFYIRSVPNRSTGYSPFELVYGDNPRTPLDLLADSLTSRKARGYKVGEWVNQLQRRLLLLREQAEVNGREAKAATKKQCDKTARKPKIKEGDMVLLRTPGLHGKLETNWEGPFQILEKVSDVNFKIDISQTTGKTRSKVVHTNNLKHFSQHQATVHRLVVAAEEDEDLNRQKNVLEGKEMEKERRMQLEAVLDEWNEVLSDTPGMTNLATHRLPTGDALPIRTTAYRLAPKWKEQIQTEIKELLEQKIIATSHSPWSSPIVPVRKPSGAVRMCIDFRRLNAVTVPDPYQMPLVEALLERIGPSTLLSKMDLSKGFYQVPLEEADMEKTAFTSPWGKFHFRRMPFGLRNAPSSFQRLMDIALGGLESFAVPYLDDILVFSTGWKEHLSHIGRVLQRLKEAGLTVKRSKCEWAKSTIEYLGHQIGNGKVVVPAMRVRAMKEYVRPQTKKGIRAFVGTTSYYRRFIENYGSLAKPLNLTLRKEQPEKVHWTEGLNSAFEKLKDSICNIGELTIPTNKDVFTLQTDASYSGIGGVLSTTRNNKELPVGYFSRQLKDRETKYSATEIEGLAVVEAIRHFEVHLVGQNFVLETDHKALEALLSSRVLNRRLTRWALFVQDFTFTLRYRSGASNGNADGLSRQEWQPTSQPAEHQILPEQEEDGRTRRKGTDPTPRTEHCFEGGGDVGTSTLVNTCTGPPGVEHPRKRADLQGPAQS